MGGLFDGLDGHEPEDWKVIERPPFGYIGSKRLSLKHILPKLPYYDGYIEPFGGSGAVMLARRPSRLEVFNDRHSGIVAFYRCLRNPELYEKLIARLELTIYSREEFIWSKDTWEDAEDPVERAARWYYMQKYSFGGKGTCFGISRNALSFLGSRLQNSLRDFPAIHSRIKNTLFENRNWKDLLISFDNPKHVFYLDPPYVDAYRGTYKYEMTIDEHRDMLDMIMDMDSFVAISGYENKLYDSYDWDGRHEWEVACSVEGKESISGRNNRDFNKQYKMSYTNEVLWIKEANNG